MTDHIDEIQRALASIPKIRVMQGTYVGPVDGRQWVDVGDRVPVSLWCPEPMVGDRVNVLFINGPGYVTGMVTPPPTEGTVMTTGGTRVLVMTDQGEFTVPYVTGYTPSSGNVVQLRYTRTGGLHIIGTLSEDVTERTAPPAPVVAGARPPSRITATWSGSAKQGSAKWFTNQVWASASNIGLYGYGTKVRDTFAAHGVPRKTEVYLPVVYDKYGNNKLGWHSLEKRSGTTPAVLALRTVKSGWVDISDLAARLATGGGVGFDGAGETVYQGVPYREKPGDTQAGALRLTYN